MRTLALAGLLLGLLGTAAGAVAAPEPSAAPGESVAKADAAAVLEFELPFALRDGEGLDRLLAAQATPGDPLYRKFLTRDEFRRRFGVDDATVAAATRILGQVGLEVTARHAQGLRVRGTVAAVERLFGAPLVTVRTADGRAITRAATQPALPAALEALGARDPMLGSLRRHHALARLAGRIPTPGRYGATGPYWFDDLKEAYGFPSFKTVTGKGRTIAILGSSDVNRGDLALYFGHEKLKAPSVRVRDVLGGAPFDPKSELSLELDIDLEQAGGMAPGADLLVYDMADTTDVDMLSAYHDMVEDNVADIVSISIGLCEKLYAPAYMPSGHKGDGYKVLDLYDSLFRQGNAQGITFVAASGDFGGLECVTPDNLLTPPTVPPRVVGKAVPGVLMPASSPHVTAVGGTNLVTRHAPGSLDSAYLRENADPDPLVPFDIDYTGNLVANAVWGSGGGYSIHFRAPAYQARVTGKPYRAVPDLAMHMGGCPDFARQPCGPDRSVDVLAFAGRLTGALGTSAAAPEFAGVLALEEERLGTRLGDVNPVIYALAAQNAQGHFFRQDIPGGNGVYKATPGYNPVLGNGTLVVKNFVGLPDDPGAGTPQTPSNP